MVGGDPGGCQYLFLGAAGRQAGSSHQQALQILKGLLTVLWISSQILILAERCVSH